MKLKAKCDVENIQDFAQYYQEGYVQTRDGRVAKVLNVRQAREQVLVSIVTNNDISREDHEAELAILSWEEAKRLLVFGKVSSGIFNLYGQVTWIYQQNNRVSKRGYHIREMQHQTLGGDRPDAFERLEGERRSDLIAWAVLYPEYQPFRLFKAGTAICMSPLWAVVPTHRHSDGALLHLLYRRDTYVGVVDMERRACRLGPTEFKKYAQYLISNLGVPCYEHTPVQ